MQVHGSGFQGFETFLLLGWTGRVIQLPNDHIPLPFGHLAAGRQSPDGPVKCYKGSLRENLKKSGFLPKALCEEPLDGDS